MCPDRHAPLQSRVVLQVATDGLTHHRVFAHEHDGLAPQGQTDGLHLLGADIVCAHDETLWEVIQQLLHTRRKTCQKQLNLTGVTIKKMSETKRPCELWDANTQG